MTYCNDSYRCRHSHTHLCDDCTRNTDLQDLVDNFESVEDAFSETSLVDEQLSESKK
jgi:hypothetical protein